MPHSDLSYTEVLSCLEDAKQGQLSPYWQGYAKRELDSLRDDTGALPPDAEILAKHLQSVLASTPQISDHTFLENEAAAQGNKLIYDYHGTSPDAFAIIIFVPADNVYTVSLSLPFSPEAAKAEASAMLNALQKSLPSPPHLHTQALSLDAVEASRYASTEDAVAALSSALRTAIH